MDRQQKEAREKIKHRVKEVIDEVTRGTGVSRKDALRYTRECLREPEVAEGK